MARLGNITVTTVIFLATFIVFCAFGTDTAFVVLSRFKLQKATETAALATVAFLKTQEDVVDNDPRALEKASQILHLSRLNVINIVSIETKKTPEGEIKVRLLVQMPVETYFLRFVAVNEVTIEAKSAAETYIQNIDDANFGETIELQSVMTDKEGEDFSIDSPNGYFVFLGVDTTEGIRWQDVSCKAKAPSTQRTLGSREFGFLCEDTSFDLSTFCDNNNIGIARYITVYRDLNPDACSVPPEAKNLKIRVLNNVKLIPPSDY